MEACAEQSRSPYVVLSCHGSRTHCSQNSRATCLMCICLTPFMPLTWSVHSSSPYRTHSSPMNTEQAKRTLTAHGITGKFVDMDKVRFIYGAKRLAVELLVPVDVCRNMTISRVQRENRKRMEGSRSYQLYRLGFGVVSYVLGSKRFRNEPTAISSCPSSTRPLQRSSRRRSTIAGGILSV